MCSLWLTLVKLMSNFICLNGSLRFDPNSVTFCNDLLHYDCLSKAYLGAGVLRPNARHFVACASFLPPWGGRDAPLRSIRSSQEKSPSPAWIYFYDANLASAFVAPGCAVCRGQGQP